MATVTHHDHFESAAERDLSYWTLGLAVALIALFGLLLFYMTGTTTTDVASIAPALNDPPLTPPALPVVPVL